MVQIRLHPAFGCLEGIEGVVLVFFFAFNSSVGVTLKTMKDGLTKAKMCHNRLV